MNSHQRRKARRRIKMLLSCGMYSSYMKGLSDISEKFRRFRGMFPVKHKENNSVESVRNEVYSISGGREGLGMVPNRE